MGQINILQKTVLALQFPRCEAVEFQSAVFRSPSAKPAVLADKTWSQQNHIDKLRISWPCWPLNRFSRQPKWRMLVNSAWISSWNSRCRASGFTKVNTAHCPIKVCCLTGSYPWEIKCVRHHESAPRPKPEFHLVYASLSLIVVISNH